MRLWQRSLCRFHILIFAFNAFDPTLFRVVAQVRHAVGFIDDILAENGLNNIFQRVDLLPFLSFLGSCRLRRKGRGFPVVAFRVPASQPVALGDGTSGLTQAPQA